MYKTYNSHGYFSVRTKKNLPGESLYKNLMVIWLLQNYDSSVNLNNFNKKENVCLIM